MDTAIRADFDALHHAQLGDRLPDLRVVHLRERAPHIRFRNHWHGTESRDARGGPQMRGRAAAEGETPEPYAVSHAITLAT
ncbi:hypothetical protein NSERKGN1266_14440 [Nocardia seriolae]|nr:hypothetical protein NSERKGN1266_14440 [Nocardia seriolae]GEM27516.1 hypothetical protein NS2_57550 [Nocardia seriolae NBRC 15557]